MSKALQETHSVKPQLLLLVNTILEKSILMELRASPVFLSASTLKKLEVGMSIIYYKSMNEPYQVMRCHNCNSSLLERIGTELYCLECDTVNNQIQVDCQFVPTAYQGNANNRNQMDLMRRVAAVLREFVGKYAVSEAEEKSMRDKLMRMKKAALNAKGTRQAAAVVVYATKKQQIRLSILEFCRENQLRQRTFNQKYLVYHKMFPTCKDRQLLEPISEEKEGSLIKMEVKVDQWHLSALAAKPSEEIVAESHEVSPAPSQQDIRKAIDIIFDSLFPNFYLRQKKQLIISKLVTKISEITPHFFTQTQPKSTLPLKLYYLIFAITKSLNYKITFQRYKDIIKSKAGYLLKKQPALDTKKQYDQLSLQKPSQESLQIQRQAEEEQLIEVFGIKIQDKNPVPRIKFPVADSQNQFSYEYYFQDQFIW